MREPAYYISCLILLGMVYVLGVWSLFVVFFAAIAYAIWFRVRYGYWQTVAEIETGSPPIRLRRRGRKQNRN